MGIKSLKIKKRGSYKKRSGRKPEDFSSYSALKKSKKSRKVRKSVSKKSRKVRKSVSKKSRKVRKSVSKKSRKVRKSVSKKSRKVRKSVSKKSRKARKSVSKKSRKARKSASKKSRKVRKSVSKKSRKARKSASKKSRKARKSASKKSRKARKSRKSRKSVLHSKCYKTKRTSKRSSKQSCNKSHKSSKKRSSKHTSKKQSSKSKKPTITTRKPFKLPKIDNLTRIYENIEEDIKSFFSDFDDLREVIGEEPRKNGVNELGLSYDDYIFEFNHRVIKKGDFGFSSLQSDIKYWIKKNPETKNMIRKWIKESENPEAEYILKYLESKYIL
jgi:hypothetical protein